MSEKIFADGVNIKTQETQYGELIKVGFKTEEFTKFLQQHDNNGWTNCILKTSKDGTKKYLELDTWKPEKKTNERPINDGIEVEDIPFR